MIDFSDISSQKTVVSKPMITYELPLSKVVQSLKKNTKIETTWEIVNLFLRSCTTVDMNTPTWLVLTIYTDATHDVRCLVEEASCLFGKPKEWFDGLNNQFIWELPADELETAIRYMVNSQSCPVEAQPKMHLRIDYKFQFIEPVTKEVLPGQEVLSHMAVFLKRNSNTMPEFCFPFAEIDSLLDYLNTIDAFLPFKKLDMKAFRLVKPNKGKTGNVIRKIVIP